MPSTQIILTENIPGLGAEADVVKVRRGFARNFLLPQGKAYEVTKSSMRKLDMLKAKRAEREAKELNEAEEIARRIGKSKVIFTLETGESGKAFGSVTANDIATRLKNEVGAEIERHRIVLESPIKSTGEHEISIKLHPDVTATMKFTVKSSTAEPKPEPVESADPGPQNRRPPRPRDRK
ncbi:MAG: 50S ribosomal protein L9 [Chthoniobacterales bacterium]|nr:50S ribosomal protein L9 [Chthoniobacterales bacterium]